MSFPITSWDELPPAEDLTPYVGGKQDIIGDQCFYLDLLSLFLWQYLL